MHTRTQSSERSVPSTIPPQLHQNTRLLHRRSPRKSQFLSAYLASPLGFTEAGRFYLQEKLLPFFDQFSDTLLVLNPWQYEIEPESEPMAIGERNLQLLTLADFVIAILDGPDVDSGTASEIGFAAAIGLPILGYRNDFRQANDHHRTSINLQVEYFIRHSGGHIVISLEELQQTLELWTNPKPAP